MALAIALACAFTATLAASQDFEFTAMKPVPPHGQPWVETAKPDVRTVALWKFVSEADLSAAADKLLEEGGLDDLGDDVDTDADPLAAGPAGKGAGGKPPKLVGKAAIKDAAGRFGGGLVVDGASYAEGAADFPGMVAREGGFTIDFWFRAADSAGKPATAAAGPQTLLTLSSLRSEPLLAIRLDDPQKIVLAFDGKDRLTAACPATADGWHHVALVVDAPRGAPDHAALALTVDGVITAAKKSDHMTPIPWMKGVLGRIGMAFTAGGGRDVTGLSGAIDEVRVSKGVYHLYPWNLGRLELEREPDAIELKAPYFKSGDAVTRLHFDGSLEP
ncbi:MAG: LamG-like jellyroll fold domain-containing protein, partial [Planctomycetia bacterium]